MSSDELIDIKLKAGDLPHRSRTILLADDEPNIVTILKRIIEKEGHTVIPASDGEEAMQILKARNFKVDLLITDIKMPEVDGISLTREIRKVSNDFEIIVITGYGTMDLFIEAIHAGANDFILKPIDRQVFLVSVNRALEKRTLTENLFARTQQLVHSEKMASLGLLATGVAHEINNPTTFIRTNIQLIGEYIKRLKPRFEDLNDPENRKMIKKIIFEDFPQMLDEAEKGTDRIQAIVAGIKHYAHLGDESFDGTVDIREVIAQAVNLVRAKLRHNITISENYRNIREINGHFSKLEQVFVNLLVNSSDAINELIAEKRAEGDREFAGVIDITATVIEGDDIAGKRTPDYLLLTFFDNGGGISEKELSKVFDPFFTTKPVGEGTGLGLYICYEIISQHGGEITVQGEPGEGTAFVIKLPVEKAKKSKDAKKLEEAEQ